uniref:Uncharacterized protein n=1 Tax=Scophthalmus maximus TaxID=52904 RepID=A0A8D3CXY4_SCOMX
MGERVIVKPVCVRACVRVCLAAKAFLPVAHAVSEGRRGQGGAVFIQGKNAPACLFGPWLSRLKGAGDEGGSVLFCAKPRWAAGM